MIINYATKIILYVISLIIIDINFIKVNIWGYINLSVSNLIFMSTKKFDLLDKLNNGIHKNLFSMIIY